MAVGRDFCRDRFPAGSLGTSARQAATGTARRCDTRQGTPAFGLADKPSYGGEESAQAGSAASCAIWAWRYAKVRSASSLRPASIHNTARMRAEYTK